VATPLLWTRQPDTVGVLGLAPNVTDGANAAGSESDLARIRDLLLCPRDLWRAFPGWRTSETVATRSGSFPLIHVAGVVAVTPSA
jgi:hypothetical protein